MRKPALLRMFTGTRPSAGTSRPKRNAALRYFHTASQFTSTILFPALGTLPTREQVIHYFSLRRHAYFLQINLDAVICIAHKWAVWKFDGNIGICRTKAVV